MSAQERPRGADPSETDLHMDETKSRIIQISFNALGIGFVLGLFTLILYYNYLMIEPYLVPLILAVLVSIPLGVMIDKFLSVVESAEISFAVSERPVTIILCAVFIPLSAVLISVFSILWLPQVFGVLAFPLLALSFFVVALAWKSQREFLITTAIILFLLVIISFPMFFLIKSCFEESVLATDVVVTYIKQNEELQTLMSDHRNSSLYKQAVAYAGSWGWDPSTLDLEKLKEHALGAVQVVGKNINIFFESSLSFVSNLGSIIVGFVVFVTTLFTVVLYKREIWNELGELSPFQSAEQAKLINSLGSSMSRIIICSAFIGMVNFTATWSSFFLTGLQLKYIFSALSAFLSIVPFTGNWLIWIPAAALLVMKGNLFYAAIVSGVHLLARYISGEILSYLPGNPHYVGMSIALGLGTFGPTGVIMGPLLAGLVVTLAEIYKGFYIAPIRATIDATGAAHNILPPPNHVRSRTVL